MVDSSEDPSEFAQFFYSRRPVGGRRTLRISYRDVQVSMSWPETPEGIADVNRLMSAMEVLMESAHKEMRISNEVNEATAEIDKEIEDLLGGEDK